ncbi:MAG: 7-cyano-7-deazaguanine synthase QueC [Candidatus Methanosuratincola sp.]|uniref:7-cyano-7-deazaguanine synthase n=2 Tax=Candidatus Methanosuratincola (ex Vanwonterghem et al. 2016) TaxID=1915412 RepID=A0A7J3UYP4_9CREN|nr:7-cyano-7-deazaguanine synthase QueC [Candidatus Methanosuratincola sp.]RWX73657.1 MAG: 7-cyano-7-deazaguanine synthase [Candidatus Methanosuratincola subterraneus]
MASRMASKKEGAVVVISGGLDSTTVLYYALDKGFSAFPITFDYGQIARAEIRSAREVSKRLGLPWRLVDLSGLSELYMGATSLVDRGIEITREFSKPIIVPFRNAVLLSAAVAYADSIGARHVLYGAHASDAENYPDCRREFVEAMERAARLGTGSDISIEAPLLSLKKSEVVRLGARLGVPFELTWSCYRDGEIHCGSCESCENRKRAFAEAGVKDPTEYLIGGSP